MAETGKVKWFNNHKGYGFIERPDGDDAFLHKSEWRGPGSGPREGQEVTFDVVVDTKGPAAKNVHPAGTERQPSKKTSVRTPKTPSKDYRFVNPYNFVRYLHEVSISTDDPPEVQLMGRVPPPPHDRWVGLTGRIECRAEAVTPIFISDSEDVQEDDAGHRSYRFFNVNGEKVIPASSLRGPVRSIFETVTNSCFANFNKERRLSYRLDPRDARRLVPGRIERKENGQWVLRLLTGTADLHVDSPPDKLYAAPVRQYKALRPSGRRRQGSPPPPIDLNFLGSQSERHGQECWAVLLSVKFPPSWRVIEAAPDRETAETLLRQAKASRKFRGELKVQQGWLCLTNQNIDNKHSERFFFSEDQVETIPLSERVRGNYEDLILDYQERHERTVRKWRNQGRDPSRAYPPDDPAFSRFILKREERQVRGGELVYAMLSGHEPNMQVRFIAPVSVPRVAYNYTIGDLLPGHLHQCQDIDALCPACRTFGWVRAGRDEREQEVAYAGRVRFSHAHLDLETANPLDSVRLEVLGSPKPTTTRFYLVGPDGRPSPTPREEAEAGYNNRNNWLRGRKVYRYYQARLENSEIKSDQNRTIRDPEGPGAAFTFTVEFENLAPAELGALLWALEVGGKGYHRLGYGKPLGLGSMAVSINRMRLRDVEARYTALTNDGWGDPLAEEAQREWVAAFQRAIVTPYASADLLAEAERRGAAAWEIIFGDLPHIQDLLALTGRQAEPDLPVHYPRSPDPNSQGQFEWFMGNKRAKGPKLELPLATEDEGLPLIDRAGKIHR